MFEIVVLVLAFVVSISILVAVHEFGHFWVARRLGIKVLRFSIGFGRPLIKKTGKRDQTEFVVSAIPLGGYVKMLDEREGPVADDERHRTFNNASVPRRLAVLAAGPAFNFLFAIFIYWLLFMSGVTELRPVIGAVTADSYADKAGLVAGMEIISVGDEATQSWQEATLSLIDDVVGDGVIEMEVADETGGRRQLLMDVGDDKRKLTEPGELLIGLGISIWPESLPPRIGVVLAGEAAESSGLISGDLILEADSQQIANWTEWYEFIRANPDRKVQLSIDREGQTIGLELAIGQMREDGATYGRIGAGPADFSDGRIVKKRFGPVEAMGRALTQTANMSAFTVRMLWRMITGDFSARNLSGPITIAQYAGETARIGPSAFVSFLAIVSISLGILNLLPVPILDGGQMVYQIAEAIQGRPLSAETELKGQQLGIVLLLMLMSLAFYNDISRLIG